MATSVRAVMQKRLLKSQQNGRLWQNNAQGDFNLEVPLGQTITQGSLADSYSPGAGAATGAVVGGVGAVVVAAGLIFFLFVRNKKRKAKRLDEEITKGEQIILASKEGIME